MSSFPLMYVIELRSCEQQLYDMSWFYSVYFNNGPIT